MARRRKKRGEGGHYIRAAQSSGSRNGMEVSRAESGYKSLRGRKCQVLRVKGRGTREIKEERRGGGGFEVSLQGGTQKLVMERPLIYVRTYERA